ncbi:MAG TPA: AraC family transcriptional regulator [Arsenicitalea sp.]|jgi:AraC-like DNA-binding protein|nr:AraC family transcriptional regulator [Arsenicitalea sp.]
MLSHIAELPPHARMIAFPRGRVALRAMPASGGIEHAERSDYSWSGLKRGLTPFVVIQHTLSGQGMLDFQGRAVPLGPGDTMLVTIPHDHRYYLERGGDWRFFYLVLSGQEVMRLAGEVIAAGGPILRLSPRALDRLAACLLALLDGEADAPGEASSLAYRAIMALVDDVLSANPVVDDAVHAEWLLRVNAHIERHLAEPLTVERLAGVAGMSRAHFVRRFSRAAGAPPSEYVFRTRMARASRLLQATQLPVLEIATACGFLDPNYFTKAFRRAFDVSPTEFRLSGLFTMPEAPRLMPVR